MNRFESILLYLSETASPVAAIRRAEALAVTNEAALLVVDVVPDSDGPWLIVPRQPELRQAVAIARLRELHALVAAIRNRYLAVDVDVLAGKPSLEIIREVLRNQHDLVLVAADESGRGLGPSRYLLRHCPCPVGVIKRGERPPHRRILAAVAPGATRSEQDDSLRVLQIAVSVAESTGSELRIIHCLSHWSPTGDSKRHLDELMARCDFGHVRYDAREKRGGVADVIAALGEEVDMVVMGTIWRGSPGTLVGDTAEEVLAQVDCSVLAVKPRGFITPVRVSERDHRPQQCESAHSSFLGPGLVKITTLWSSPKTLY